MSSHEFDIALQEVGSDASGSRLCELISTATFSGKGLPATAENYLRTFCNDDFSVLQRRWLGLALASMMHASASVVNHLSGLSHDLHSLGHIILEHGEAEELKVMAGIIMRLGLEKGIDFSNFWASDKVKNSIPPFPRESDPHWMMKFQTFMQAINELKLADTTTGDSVVYPVAIVDSDGFKWGHADLAVGFLQGTHLTVIAPDYTLGRYQYIDIPLGHILSAESQQSRPFNSQSESLKANPKLYDIELVLQADSWTYYLDASEHTANKISFQFATSEEATEWEETIKQHQLVASKTKASQPPASSAQNKIGSTSNSQLRRSRTLVPGLDQDVDTGSSASGPSSRRAHHRSSHCSEPIDISRPRSARYAPSVVDDPLGPHGEDDQTLVEDSYPLTNEKQSEQPQRLNGPNPTRLINSNDGKADQSIEADLSDEAGDGPSVPKPTTAEVRKGKLPKVSHATKVNAIQPRQKRAQDFDDPPERATRKSARKTKAVSSDVSDDGSPRQKSQVKPKASTHVSNANNKSKKTQSRRKADDDDDDDEFIPSKPSQKTKRGDKRKGGPDAVADDVQPKKKTRSGLANAPVSSSAVKLRTRRTEAQRDEVSELVPSQKETRTKEARQKSIEARPSLMGPPRNTLIGGLLKSQESPKASTAASKMSSQPAWANQTPSTPTKPSRSRPAARNLFEAQRFPEQSPAYIASSPMVGSSMRGDRSLTRQAFADTEILSSNTKRGPASPNAESTAISGHADQEEVDMDKKIADNETARSDPFKRRSDKHKITTFTRRLTSEHSPIDDFDMQEGRTRTVPVEIDCDDISEDELAPRAANPFLSRRQPALVIKRQILGVEQPGSQPFVRAAGSTFVSSTPKSAKDRSRATSKKALQSLDDEPPLKPSSPSRISRSPHIRSDGRSAEQRLTTARGPGKSTARVREERLGVRKGEAISVAPNRVTPTTQPEHHHGYEENVYPEDDTTLVDYEGDSHCLTNPTTPGLQFLSSPPIPGSISNHSSTSADSNVSPEVSPPTSQVEATEWEDSLHSYQRPLRDLLARICKKVLHGVFDNESAVLAIAEEFSRDGQHLLDSMLERHDAEYADAFKDLEEKKKLLRKELEATARNLAKERARMHATE